MALKSGQPTLSGGVNQAFKRLDPAKYTSLGDFINEVNRPDIREALTKTYGDQGITGFLQMTGALKTLEQLTRFSGGKKLVSMLVRLVTGMRTEI